MLFRSGMRENKFGIAHTEAERLYAAAAALPGIEIVGIGCHIGSQLTEPAPVIEAAQRLLELAGRIEAAGVRLRHIDIGGGAGIRYRNEAQCTPKDFVGGVVQALGDRRHALIVDPGRSVVGNAGVLLTRVEYVKPGAARNFLVVDAAMNDLLRPSLYGAWHEVRPVRAAESKAPAAVYDIEIGRAHV